MHVPLILMSDTSLIQTVTKRLKRMIGSQKAITQDTKELDAKRQEQATLVADPTASEETLEARRETTERLDDRARSLGTREQDLATDAQELSTAGLQYSVPCKMPRVASLLTFWT